MATSKYRNAYCSFCRKSYLDVGPLVEGPGDVYICGECSELCLVIIAEEKTRRGAPPGSPAHDADSSLALQIMRQFEVDRWPVRLRIALVDEIWRSIAATPNQVPLTEDQKRELDRRIADLNANPNNVRTWEEIKALVRGRAEPPSNSR